MEVSFRSIVEDDFQAVCELIPSEEELFLVYDRGKFPLTVAEVAKLVERRMDPIVMVCRGAVVGFACYYNYQEGRSVFIGNIVIDRSVRGQGLGKRIVTYMIDRAFSLLNLQSVRLHVYNRNLPALLVYNGLGFQPYAMKVQRDYKGEPVIFLSLGLRRDAWPTR